MFMMPQICLLSALYILSDWTASQFKGDKWIRLFSKSSCCKRSKAPFWKPCWFAFGRIKLWWAQLVTRQSGPFIHDTKAEEENQLVAVKRNCTVFGVLSDGVRYWTRTLCCNYKWLTFAEQLYWHSMVTVLFYHFARSKGWGGSKEQLSCYHQGPQPFTGRIDIRALLGNDPLLPSYFFELIR